MMKKGLNTLQQLVKDRTEEFISELFSSYVIVTEKIDAARISFQVKDGMLSIWRKDERYPISIVDRTLMQYYEKAIDHITSVIDYAVLPENYRFGCYYFSSLTPNKTQYKRMPKNNIVLTDVRVIGQDGEKIKDNGESIRKWATELRVEPAPIIFEGYLTDKQKVKILDYIKLTPKELHDRYGTQTFSEFLIRTLNPNINSSFLQEEGVFRPDSIIFRFKTKDGGAYVAKTLDPLIAGNAEMNEEIPESRVPSDLYSIALMDVYSFILERGLNYKLRERTPEFRYLELICLLFNDFIEANMDRYRGVDFSVPNFLKSKEFELNRRFIENEKTLELMTLDRSYEQLFKIILAGLRKKRRRTYGLLTQSMINQINLLIDEIRDLVEMPLVEGFMDFSTFRIFKDDLMNKFIDPDELKSIEYDDEPMKKTATVVVARPLVMTKELEKKIRDISEFDRVFFICLPNEASPFTKDGIVPQIDAYASSCKDALACHFCDDDDQVKQRLSEISEEYDIESICATSDVCQWLKNCIAQEVGDIGHIDDEHKVIEYILKDDFSRFKSLCPTYINSMYMALQKDIEKTQKIDYQT
jgi:hypothetical protein